MQSVLILHWAVQQGGVTGAGRELSRPIAHSHTAMEKPSLNSHSDKICFTVIALTLVLFIVYFPFWIANAGVNRCQNPGTKFANWLLSPSWEAGNRMESLHFSPSIHPCPRYLRWSLQWVIKGPSNWDIDSLDLYFFSTGPCVQLWFEPPLCSGGLRYGSSTHCTLVLCYSCPQKTSLWQSVQCLPRLKSVHPHTDIFKKCTGVVQTVERQGLSRKIWPKEVPWVIRLSRGAAPDYPRDLLWARFPDNPSGLSTVCQTFGFKNRRRCRPEFPHGLVWRNSKFGLPQVWHC